MIQIGISVAINCLFCHLSNGILRRGKELCRQPVNGVVVLGAHRVGVGLLEDGAHQGSTMTNRTPDRSRATGPRESASQPALLLTPVAIRGVHVDLAAAFADVPGQRVQPAERKGAGLQRPTT